jgi:hypothetical protein
MHERNIVSIDRVDTSIGVCSICGNQHYDTDLVDANDHEFQLHEACMITWDFEMSGLPRENASLAKTMYRRYLFKDTHTPMALKRTMAILDSAAKSLKTAETQAELAKWQAEIANQKAIATIRKPVNMADDVMSENQVNNSVPNEADITNKVEPTSKILQEDTMIGRRFKKFHEAHPQVYAELVKLTRKIKGNGYTQVRILMLFEVIRYRKMMQKNQNVDQCVEQVKKEVFDIEEFFFLKEHPEQNLQKGR